MTIIDGKKCALAIEASIQQRIKEKRLSPVLTFFLVGSDPASTTYIQMKKKACKKVGITSKVALFPDTISEKALLEAVQKENENPQVHGILVQMPLPSHIHPLRVIKALDPRKDVDGFHPENMGKLLLGDPSGIVPCTPKGILHLLQSIDIPLQEKNVLIVGRSTIVGKPLAALLLQKTDFAPSSVSVAHSRTKSISSLMQKADILILHLCTWRIMSCNRCLGFRKYAKLLSCTKRWGPVETIGSNNLQLFFASRLYFLAS